MEDLNKIVLIHKVLSGYASDDEKLLVEERINGEKDFKEIFNHLEMIWDKSIDIKKTPVSFSKSELKKEIFNHIDRPLVKFEHKSIKEFRKKGFKVSLAIAAVFLVLVSVLTVFYNSYFSGTYLKARNEMVFKELPDNSKVLISKNSSIRYSGDFAKADRTVILNGSAFFNITHDDNKPFIIKTADNTIKVVGTSFQVNNIGNKNVEVIVFSGIVNFYSKNGKFISLGKGEGAVCDNREEVFTAVDKHHFKSDLRADYLRFQNAELSFVFNRLSELFDCQINVKCADVSRMNGYTSPGVAGDSIEFYFKTIRKLYKVDIIKTMPDKYEVVCP